MAAPFDSCDDIVDPSASAPLPLTEPPSPDIAYRTISLSEETAKLASRSGGTCMQSPVVSTSKSNVSKFESYKFLDYFDQRSVNIETPSRALSNSGKHGSMRVLISEPQSSDDDMRKFTSESAIPTIHEKTRRLEM